MARSIRVTLNPKVKKPSEAFTKCPSCFGRRLLIVGIDVICSSCDWNSIEAFAEAGGLDYWESLA